MRGADGHFPTPGAAPMKRLGEGEPSLLSALLFFFFFSFLYCWLSVPADTIVLSAPRPANGIKMWTSPLPSVQLHRY